MPAREACGACAGTDLPVFLDLGKTPLANTFPATVDEAEVPYPLQLGRCSNCGLVQMMEVVPDDLIYGPDYGFYSGGSAAQRAYHKAGAQLLMRRFNLEARRGVLEIACNDGSLLRHFDAAGFPTMGVDPAAGPVKQAQAAGLNVDQAPFTAAKAAAMRDLTGPFGLVIAYNSMAHIADLSDVLTGIWAVMDDESIAVVEVQYLPDLIAGNLIGQVYHEHRYFYSLTSFQHAAALHQLRVIDAELIELQGGGLRVTLARDQHRPPPTPRVAQILASEQWLANDCAFTGMQGRVERNRDHLLALIAEERAQRRVVSGYAAAAKATTILNFCGLTRDDIPWVEDTTPYKWGRQVPGVRIPIVQPGDKRVDTRLLLTGNYLPYVLRADRAFIERNGGRWIVAEPTPMII